MKGGNYQTLNTCFVYAINLHTDTFFTIRQSIVWGKEETSCDVTSLNYCHGISTRILIKGGTTVQGTIHSQKILAIQQG